MFDFYIIGHSHDPRKQVSKNIPHTQRFSLRSKLKTDDRQKLRKYFQNLLGRLRHGLIANLHALRLLQTAKAEIQAGQQELFLQRRNFRLLPVGFMGNYILQLGGHFDLIAMLFLISRNHLRMHVQTNKKKELDHFFFGLQQLRNQSSDKQ